MAAPTAMRVEATSTTTTKLRWTYGGAATIAVYRSVDGAAYSEITNIDTRVAVGTTEYNDTGLSVSTKYWYKTSDDAGSTFSSVVTVWTHSCAGPVSELQGIDLPEFLRDEDITPERLNEMERRIEGAINGQEISPEQCIACPDDGAVVIDCRDGCTNWTVIADTNINSISIQWCDEFDGTIDFVIPPSTTVGICGFPAGFGFGGDECTQAPIAGGTNGKTMGVKFTGGGAGGGGVSPGGTASRPGAKPVKGNTSQRSSGGGQGGSGCACIPGADNALTIKSCNSNNSLNCTGTKSLTLIACGGRGPYTWGRTGSVSLQGASGTTPGATASGERIKVTPPTNSGTGVAGIAYEKYGGRCEDAGNVQQPCSSNHFEVFVSEYGCNDQVLSSCGAVGGFAVSGSCVASPVNIGNASCASVSPCADNGTCTNGACDARSAAQIADGCNPCGAQTGATVTVTDALGKQATVILRP